MQSKKANDAKKAANGHVDLTGFSSQRHEQSTKQMDIESLDVNSFLSSSKRRLSLPLSNANTATSLDEKDSHEETSSKTNLKGLYRRGSNQLPLLHPLKHEGKSLAQNAEANKTESERIKIPANISRRLSSNTSNTTKPKMKDATLRGLKQLEEPQKILKEPIAFGKFIQMNPHVKKSSQSPSSPQATTNAAKRMEDTDDFDSLDFQPKNLDLEFNNTKKTHSRSVKQQEDSLENRNAKQVANATVLPTETSQSPSEKSAAGNGDEKSDSATSLGGKWDSFFWSAKKKTDVPSKPSNREPDPDLETEPEPTTHTEQSALLKVFSLFSSTATANNDTSSYEAFINKDGNKIQRDMEVPDIPTNISPLSDSSNVISNSSSNQEMDEKPLKKKHLRHKVRFSDFAMDDSAPNISSFDPMAAQISLPDSPNIAPPKNSSNMQTRPFSPDSSTPISPKSNRERIADLLFSPKATFNTESEVTTSSSASNDFPRRRNSFHIPSGDKEVTFLSELKKTSQTDVTNIATETTKAGLNEKESSEVTSLYDEQFISAKDRPTSKKPNTPPAPKSYLQSFQNFFLGEAEEGDEADEGEDKEMAKTSSSGSPELIKKSPGFIPSQLGANKKFPLLAQRNQPGESTLMQRKGVSEAEALHTPHSPIQKLSHNDSKEDITDSKSQFSEPSSLSQPMSLRDTYETSDELPFKKLLKKKTKTTNLKRTRELQSLSLNSVSTVTESMSQLKSPEVRIQSKRKVLSSTEAFENSVLSPSVSSPSQSVTFKENLASESEKKNAEPTDEAPNEGLMHSIRDLFWGNNTSEKPSKDEATASAPLPFSQHAPDDTIPARSRRSPLESSAPSFTTLESQEDEVPSWMRKSKRSKMHSFPDSKLTSSHSGNGIDLGFKELNPASNFSQSQPTTPLTNIQAPSKKSSTISDSSPTREGQATVAKRVELLSNQHKNAPPAPPRVFGKSLGAPSKPALTIETTPFHVSEENPNASYLAPIPGGLAISPIENDQDFEKSTTPLFSFAPQKATIDPNSDQTAKTNLPTFFTQEHLQSSVSHSPLETQPKKEWFSFLNQNKKEAASPTFSFTTSPDVSQPLVNQEVGKPLLQLDKASKQFSRQPELHLNAYKNNESQKGLISSSEPEKSNKDDFFPNQNPSAEDIAQQKFISSTFFGKKRKSFAFKTSKPIFPMHQDKPVDARSKGVDIPALHDNEEKDGLNTSFLTSTSKSSSPKLTSISSPKTFDKQNQNTSWSSNDVPGAWSFPTLSTKNVSSDHPESNLQTKNLKSQHVTKSAQSPSMLPTLSYPKSPLEPLQTSVSNAVSSIESSSRIKGSTLRLEEESPSTRNTANSNSFLENLFGRTTQDSDSKALKIVSSTASTSCPLPIVSDKNRPVSAGRLSSPISFSSSTKVASPIKDLGSDSKVHGKRGSFDNSIPSQIPATFSPEYYSLPQFYDSDKAQHSSKSEIQKSKVLSPISGNLNFSKEVSPRTVDEAEIPTSRRTASLFAQPSSVQKEVSSRYQEINPPITSFGNTPSEDDGWDSDSDNATDESLSPLVDSNGVSKFGQLFFGNYDHNLSFNSETSDETIDNSHIEKTLPNQLSQDNLLARHLLPPVLSPSQLSASSVSNIVSFFEPNRSDAHHSNKFLPSPSPSNAKPVADPSFPQRKKLPSVPSEFFSKENSRPARSPSLKNQGTVSPSITKSSSHSAPYPAASNGFEKSYSNVQSTPVVSTAISHVPPFASENTSLSAHSTRNDKALSTTSESNLEATTSKYLNKEEPVSHLNIPASSNVSEESGWVGRISSWIFQSSDPTLKDESANTKPKDVSPHSDSQHQLEVSSFVTSGTESNSFESSQVNRYQTTLKPEGQPQFQVHSPSAIREKSEATSNFRRASFQTSSADNVTMQNIVSQPSPTYFHSFVQAPSLDSKTSSSIHAKKSDSSVEVSQRRNSSPSFETILRPFEKEFPPTSVSRTAHYPLTSSSSLYLETPSFFAGIIPPSMTSGTIYSKEDFHIEKESDSPVALALQSTAKTSSNLHGFDEHAYALRKPKDLKFTTQNMNESLSPLSLKLQPLPTSTVKEIKPHTFGDDMNLSFFAPALVNMNIATPQSAASHANIKSSSHKKSPLHSPRIASSTRKEVHFVKSGKEVNPSVRDGESNACMSPQIASLISEPELFSLGSNKASNKGRRNSVLDTLASFAGFPRKSSPSVGPKVTHVSDMPQETPREFLAKPSLGKNVLSKEDKNNSIVLTKFSSRPLPKQDKNGIRVFSDVTSILSPPALPPRATSHLMNPQRPFSDLSQSVESNRAPILHFGRTLVTGEEKLNKSVPQIKSGNYNPTNFRLAEMKTVLNANEIPASLGKSRLIQKDQPVFHSIPHLSNTSAPRIILRNVGENNDFVPPSYDHIPLPRIQSTLKNPEQKSKYVKPLEFLEPEVHLPSKRKRMTSAHPPASPTLLSLPTHQERNSAVTSTLVPHFSTSVRSSSAETLGTTFNQAGPSKSSHLSEVNLNDAVAPVKAEKAEISNESEKRSHQKMYVTKETQFSPTLTSNKENFSDSHPRSPRIYDFEDTFSPKKGYRVFKPSMDSDYLATIDTSRRIKPEIKEKRLFTENSGRSLFAKGFAVFCDQQSTDLNSISGYSKHRGSIHVIGELPLRQSNMKRPSAHDGSLFIDSQGFNSRKMSMSPSSIPISLSEELVHDVHSNAQMEIISHSRPTQSPKSVVVINAVNIPSLYSSHSQDSISFTSPTVHYDVLPSSKISEVPVPESYPSPPAVDNSDPPYFIIPKDSAYDSKAFFEVEQQNPETTAIQKMNKNSPQNEMIEQMVPNLLKSRKGSLKNGIVAPVTTDPAEPYSLHPFYAVPLGASENPDLSLPNRLSRRQTAQVFPSTMDPKKYVTISPPKPLDLYSTMQRPMTSLTDFYSDKESQVSDDIPISALIHKPEMNGPPKLPGRSSTPYMASSSTCNDILTASVSFREALQSVVAAGEHLASILESVHASNYARHKNVPEPLKRNLVFIVDLLRLLSSSNDQLSKIVSKELEHPINFFANEHGIVGKNSSYPSHRIWAQVAEMNQPLADLDEAFFPVILSSTEGFAAGTLSCFYNLGYSFRVLAELTGDKSTVSAEASTLFRQLSKIKHAPPFSILSTSYLYGVGKVNRLSFGKKTRYFN